jgi:hypothetical protein
MSLANDLLEQSEQLVRPGPGRPKQARLRRAVSGGYYALFHLLIEASRRFVVGGSAPSRGVLRNVLARCYEHGQMSKAAKQFANGSSPWWSSPCSPELKGVAMTFVEAQRLRHAADYDLGRSFTRLEAVAHIERIKHAFSRWKAIAKRPEAQAYMLALLVSARRD